MVLSILIWYAMILPILQVGDPILIQKALLIEDLAAVESLIIDMKETLTSTGKGVGLAAPQVGESVCLFLIHPRPTANYPDQEDEGLIVVINPEIIGMSDEMVTGYEGYLSVSSQNGAGMLRAEVPRQQRVDVRFTNEEGDVVARRFEGFGAVIFQHEYDHLEGVLFLSRVEDWGSLRSSR